MNALLQQLADYRPFTALVIGDFMLDEQVHGAAERLSPDAPVPVLHARKWESTPGGASNVALCLVALKAQVACLGVVGADEAAATLRERLAKEGCDVGGLVEDSSRPTTLKQSMIGLAQHRHPQKMFRVDVESREPIDSDLTKRLLSEVESRISATDVVCLEDYDKGVCTPEVCAQVIELCRTHDVPVLIDPASIDSYDKYRGATAITPNRSEAERATSLDEPLEATEDHNLIMATRLLSDLDLKAVVLTLDKTGAMLATRDADPVTVPTIARSVYDVTGAGDVVLAALAGAVANGFSWMDAVRFANAAAGLEVEQVGAQPIPFTRVRQSLVELVREDNGKARSLAELVIELDVHREAGRKIVLTNGCFDVIHAGHVGYLREAKSLGDILVVGINGDEQVAAQKGAGRPVYDESERLEILAAFEFIDYLVIFPEPTAHKLIEAVRPDIYVKGGDYRPEEVNEYDLLRPMIDRSELQFRTIGFRPGLSSSAVIERFTRAYHPDHVPVE